MKNKIISILLFLVSLIYIAISIDRQFNANNSKMAEHEEQCGEYIIVYHVLNDNKLHIYEWQKADGITEQVLIGYTAFFNTFLEAEMKAKERCPYEYEVFCIGW